MSRRPNTSESSPLLNGDTETLVAQEDRLQRLPSNILPSQAFKIAAAMYSFTTLGLFNSSLGAVLPLLSHHYSLTDLHVSSIFLVGPLGYVLAAQCSDTIHYRFGQRGIAVAGPVLQILSTTFAAAHPAFGWVLVAFAAQGLGTGLLDGSWCAWAGSMERANTVSGLLHGSYSVGGAVGPFLVTFLAARGRAWWEWYFILTGATTLSFIVLVAAFRHEDATAYRQSKRSSVVDVDVDAKAMFKHRATWFCAAYFLTYVGTETAISGWVVSFMWRYRHSSLTQSGLTSSGYWIGMAVGRLTLGFATDRIGVRRATMLYFCVAIALEALFAIVASSAVSVVLMVMLGFIMGPLFPSGVVVLTRLLPGELHVAAVSFVASLGQVGGALLPFAIGAVVEGLGIGVFRFAILVQTILSLFVWIAFARLRPALQPVHTARLEE